MNISPNELRRQTVEVLKGIENQISIVRDDAAERNINPHRMIDTTGAPLLTPLLAAKAQCLNTLVLLQGK